MNSMLTISFNPGYLDGPVRSSSTRFMTVAEKTRHWVRQKIKRKKRLNQTLNRNPNNRSVLATDISFYNPNSKIHPNRVS